VDTEDYEYFYQCQWLKTEFGLVIGNIGYIHVVTTDNWNTVIDFHTTKHSTLLPSVSTSLYGLITQELLKFTITRSQNHCTISHITSSNHTLNVHRVTSCTLLHSSSLLLACCTPPAYCYTLVGKLLTATTTTRNSSEPPWTLTWVSQK
jgi:hypothetical protein